jgi:transposase
LTGFRFFPFFSASGDLGDSWDCPTGTPSPPEKFDAAVITRFARSGLNIPPATIGHWVKIGAEPLMILYEAYQKIIFGSDYLQMDETTTLKVLEDGKGKTHLGFLWAVFDPVHKLPFFFYQKGRDHRGPKNFLERFAGVLQCDGFSFETLNRKLYDELHGAYPPVLTPAARERPTALTLKTSARNLGLDADQRLQLRLEESKPVFDTLGQWLQTEYDKTTPASAIGKAIQYALNRWKNMPLFLSDGKIEIDNNLVENIIRPAAIGRKNYLFAGQP